MHHRISWLFLWALVAVVALRVPLNYATWEIAIIVALAVLVISRHLGNIQRLLRRQENDLGARPS